MRLFKKITLIVSSALLAVFLLTGCNDTGSGSVSSPSSKPQENESASSSSNSSTSGEDSSEEDSSSSGNVPIGANRTVAYFQSKGISLNNLDRFFIRGEFETGENTLYLTYSLAFGRLRETQTSSGVTVVSIVAPEKNLMYYTTGYDSRVICLESQSGQSGTGQMGPLQPTQYEINNKTYYAECSTMNAGVYGQQKQYFCFEPNGTELQCIVIESTETVSILWIGGGKGSISNGSTLKRDDFLIPEGLSIFKLEAGEWKDTGSKTGPDSLPL